ncbi:Scr1 family TA system antitoxin-like transcriptional regulator [Streptosporangium sp. NPDC049304]|uniref:Scr1 family TA system antitoxin-like transcriptional regulator n=1 Tax=Streptosporangium sp. NPDC049304 TaxID=3154830 RepID=UPI0034161F68
MRLRTSRRSGISRSIRVHPTKVSAAGSLHILSPLRGRGCEGLPGVLREAIQSLTKPTGSSRPCSIVTRLTQQVIYSARGCRRGHAPCATSNELGRRPNVMLQILPYRAGAHPAMTGSFTVVGFPASSDLDVIYLENMSSGLYLEDAADVRRYVSVFDYLRAAALSPADTMTMLTNAPNNPA